MPDLDSPILCPCRGSRSAKEGGAQILRAPLSPPRGKKALLGASCGAKSGQKTLQLTLERADWLTTVLGTSSLRVTTTSKVLSVPDCWAR